MNDGTDVTPKPAAPQPQNNGDGTITLHATYVLPAPLEKRKEIAIQLGFVNANGEAEIARVRDALSKGSDEEKANAKSYIETVKNSAEKIEGSVTYPDVAQLAPEVIQELLASLSKNYARAAILSARRKGEELPTLQSFTIYDLMGEDEEEGEYDKDAVSGAVDAFCKEHGFNEATTAIIVHAVVGSKAQMLRLRKFFKNMENAQNKFSSWAAEKADLDFDAITLWMKRQAKRLSSAMATKEISENEVTI